MARAEQQRLEDALTQDAPRLAAAQDTWYRLSTLAERLRGTVGLAQERAAAPRGRRRHAHPGARPGRAGRRGRDHRRAGGGADRGRRRRAAAARRGDGGAHRARGDARRCGTRPRRRRPGAGRPPGRARDAGRPGGGPAQRRLGERRGDRAPVRGAGRGGRAHPGGAGGARDGPRRDRGRRRGRRRPRRSGGGGGRRPTRPRARGCGSWSRRSGRPSSSGRTGARGWMRCRSAWPGATARARCSATPPRTASSERCPGWSRSTPRPAPPSPPRSGSWPTPWRSSRPRPPSASSHLRAADAGRASRRGACSVAVGRAGRGRIRRRPLRRWAGGRPTSSTRPPRWPRRSAGSCPASRWWTTSTRPHAVAAAGFTAVTRTATCSAPTRAVGGSAGGASALDVQAAVDEAVAARDAVEDELAGCACRWRARARRKRRGWPT